MLQLRRDNTPNQMSDKKIMEKVLGRESNRLSGWGRSPKKSEATCMGGSSRPTNTRALNEIEAKYAALKDELMKIQQSLIDHGVLPPSSFPHAPAEHNMDLKQKSDDEKQFEKEAHLSKDDLDMPDTDDEVQFVDENDHFMVLSIHCIL